MGQKLGQHFLTSTTIAKRIASESDATATDIVLEIGPGRGALTKELILFSAKVVAIEKDPELVQYLKEKFANEIENDRLEVLEKDVLDFDPESLRFYKEFDYQVVANIPYYITGAIIRKFLTTSYQPKKMVLMIQKEVAERIVARDGKESILSLSVKAYGEPKIVEKVPKRYFSPQPKVDSAVLAIENISRDFFDKNNIDEATFFKYIKAAFAHKRKTLANNMHSLAPKETIIDALKKTGLGENVRAEKLNLEKWVGLLNYLEN